MFHMEEDCRLKLAYRKGKWASAQKQRESPSKEGYYPRVKASYYPRVKASRLVLKH